ncbi:MAG: hypothetical protein B6I24_07250 [Bacteroidetes bacterium 4572_128]|nr:MAG: hypothetical protein B6I24_07250 [Bacteroidetes bacterium 4572_128]
MRIISGSHKGKIIKINKFFTARPTTDFAKENLFNIISNFENFDFEKSKVLDLFAGSGSISYEFASRNCKNITSVELKLRHFLLIKKNIKDFNFKSINLMRKNFFSFCNNCKEDFDLIFADPPYDFESVEKVPGLIFEKKILRENGTFILEHSSKINFSKNKFFIQKRKYGYINFSFFQNKKP